MFSASLFPPKRFSAFISFFVVLLSFHVLAQKPTISYSSSTLAFPVGNSVPAITPTSSGVAGGLTFSGPTTLTGLNGNFDMDPYGNLWFGASYLGVIRKVGGYQTIQNPLAIYSITSDRDGNIYFINNSILKRIDVGRTDNYNVGAAPASVSGMAIATDGTVWISEGYGNGQGNGTVSKKLPGGNFGAVCTGEFGGVVVGKDGSVYLAEGYNNRIRKLSLGSNTPVNWGPSLRNVKDLSIDDSGNIYALNLNDNGGYEITMIPPGDGNGTRTKISLPTNFNATRLAWSSDGRIYYSKYSGASSIADILYIEKRSGYAIYPNLPLGLNFDMTTGVISGTATTSVPERTYTVQAFNAEGATSTTLKIRTGTSNVTLTNLTTQQGAISPAFSSATTEYTMTVASNISKVNINPASLDASAKVTISGNVVPIGTNSADIPLNSGDNVINVLVESGDGKATKTYKLTVTRTIDVELGVTLTNNQTEYVSGSTSTYALEVKNNGSTNVSGAAVAGNFLAGATWTATFTGGATGTASGSGNISQSVNLPAGSKVDYLIIQPTSATQTGDIIGVATVSVSPPYKDTFAGNDLVSDTDVGKPTFRAVNEFSAYPAFSAVYNKPSSSVLFFLSASNLRSQILVTPPTAFEVSADNITYVSTLSVGDIGRQNNAAFYLRLKAGIPVGTYTGDFVFTSQGATQLKVATLPSTVSPLSNAITFTLDAKQYGQADFAPGATSNNTVDAITYVSDNLSVATIVAGKIHITGSGTANITASQVAGNNYEAPIPVSKQFTVNKLPVTVQAQTKTKVYGAADPVLTYTVTPAILAGDSFTGTLSRTAGEMVGNYVIRQNTLALNSNYIMTFQSNTLAITQKTITVTVNAQTKVYGDADPSLTYSISPVLISGDNFTGALSRATGEGVGVRTITQNTLALGPNYSIIFVANNLSIIPKTITVIATPKSKIYGDADPALSYTFTPALIPGDSFTGNVSRATGENIGDYAINQGSLALNTNYNLTYAPADLSIGKKTITVAAVAASKTYGDADPALSYTFAPALISGDSFTGNISRAAGENIGNYAINQGSLALNTNYNLTYALADLSIGKKTIAVAAVAASKTYGDADPVLNYTFTPALIPGDSFSGNISRATGENIGDYAINQGSLTLNTNYNLTYTSADLSIGNKTIAVAAAAASKTYGDADPVLSYTFTPALSPGDSFSGNISRATGENIGDYTIGQGSLVLNDNYTITYTPADLSIGKKTIAVAAVATSKTYGDADPVLNYTFTPALISNDSFAGNISRATGENIGDYAINQGSLALNTNYNLTYAPAALSIGKKTIAVAAVATTKTYGDADPVLNYTFTPALISGDSFAGNISRATGENIGDYTIGQESLALNDNYTVNYTPAALSIGKKTIAVAAVATSKTYGDVDPALSYTFTPALIPGDTFAGNISRAIGENIGDYAINQGSLNLNTNYNLTYAPAALSIGKKTITVTAVSTSKTYGDADPALNYTFTPALISGDSFTGNISRATGENIGNYAINQGSLALNTNYNLTYAPADLSIGKKIIAVAAVATTKTYGDADPALNYTFMPALIVGDSFTGNINRVTGENIGDYTIGQGSLALNNNYTITYAPAALSIGKRTIAVAAAATSKTYGDADPALSYTFTPALIPGDSFTGNISRATGENIGDYAINQGSLALNTNYNLTYAPAALSIGKKTIAVAAVATTKTYGDADPALSYTFTPALIPGDSFTGNISRATGENIGDYAIGQGSLALNNNYTITYAPAALSIGKKTIAVAAAATSKTYGDADPVLSYTFTPALIPGDSFTGNVSRAAGENIGNYAINQGSLALNTNYNLTYTPAALSIGKKTIAVAAAATSKTYGDADPVLNYTFMPALIPGDSFSGNVSRATGENIGNYAINQGSLALNTNYNLTYAPADLSIGKKTITVAAVAASKTYGDADPVLNYTFTPALIPGDSFAGNISRATGENIGDYTIGQGSLALNDNYTVTYAPADLSIGKKTIAVAAVAASKTYGDADPVLSYTFTPALIPGDSFTGNISRATGENIGDYTIGQGSLALNDNYTVTYAPADLSIGKKTIAVAAVATSKTYGDADPALSYTFTPALIPGDSFTGNISRATGENIGDYAINQGSLALNTNYNLTYAPSDLSIGKKTVAVAATATSKTYGDADPVLSYTFTPALIPGDSFSGNVSRATGENIGNYAINQGSLALNTNYNLTYAPADLSIGKKTIAVAAVATSKTYGDADPALSYTFTPALISGDSFTGNISRATGENIGDYAINQGSLALNTNYNLTYAPADLSIGKKTITVAAVAASKTYGDADPALNYTFMPALIPGDSFTGNVSRATGENIGDYAINQGSLALNTNYNLTYSPAALSIGKKTITVTAVGISKTYGDADPVLSYTFTPALIPGDSFSGNVSRATGENIGNYAINQGSLALNTNYNLTYDPADLSIGKKTIAVAAVATSKTYGDADPVLSYTFTPALIPGDSFSGNISRATGENIGDYAINQGSLALNDNYTVSYMPAALSIGRKTIAVAAAATSKTYGDADPVLSYTFTPALSPGDSFSGNISRATGENIGDYTIGQGSLVLNDNYTITYTPAALSIGKKTVAVAAAAASKTYGDADPALSYTFTPSLSPGDSFSGNISRATGENIGDYAISQGSLTLNTNYNLTYAPAALSIGKKTIAVAAVATSKTYGDVDPVLSYTFTPALMPGDSFTGNISRVTGENIGDYTIGQGSLVLNDNYTVNYTPAALSIGKKTIAVAAVAASKTYGDADPVLSYTFTPALIPGDTFTGNISRATGENIGNYAINQGSLALNNNYNLTYAQADLSIGKKTIAVAAAATSKTYGDADPVLSYTFTPALIPGDSFTGNVSRAAGENIGNYAINQGSLALNTNYNLTYTPAALSIGKKTIAVAAAATSKTYGDADPVLNYTFMPALIPGDSFSGNVSRATGENIGDYTIGQGSLVLNNNYTITYTPADLSIGKKTVTVTAAAKSKTYGDADPALNYTFAPALVTGDSFTGSLNRAVGENVGTYAINQGTLALNTNYTLTYVGDNLTIGAKTITVTAAAKSKTYGDADPALTYTSAPALVGTDTFTGSLTRAAGENIGTYAINQGTLALNANYTLTYVSANLTIGAKTITVTAAAKSKTYGDADPALTYTFAPALQTGDSFSGSLTRAAGENAGTYAINQGTVTLNGNYAITYVGANLTINKAVLTVSANNAVMCQSDGFPTFGVSYSGFKVGDTESSLTTKPTVSTTANRNVAGNYTLVPAGGLANNYSFVYVNGILTINALPTVNIVSNKGTDISKGETAVLTASGGTSYSWSAASGIISGQNTATLTVRPAQTTTYTVRVTNANGCSSIATITIKVAEDYKIVANNILTPNGDGVNDTWIVQNIDMYPGNEVRIFDRNGREMYNKKGYDNSWNGTIGGNELAEGTYYYIITYGPAKLVQKGFITIIRNR